MLKWERVVLHIMISYIIFWKYTLQMSYFRGESKTYTAVPYSMQYSACRESWWRPKMETISSLQDICVGNSPVPGEFPAQRPVTRSFDVFFDLRLNNRLSKQSWGWWSERLSLSLWRHCNVMNVFDALSCLVVILFRIFSAISFMITLLTPSICMITQTP